MSIVCGKCDREFGLEDLQRAKGRCPGCGAEIPTASYCFRRPTGVFSRFSSAPMRVKIAYAVNALTFMVVALYAVCSVPSVSFDKFSVMLLAFELSLMLCLCFMERIAVGGYRLASAALLLMLGFLHFAKAPGANMLVAVALEIVGGAVLSVLLLHDSVRRWRQVRRDESLAYTIARRYGRKASLPPRRKSPLCASSVLISLSTSVAILLPLLALSVRSRDFVDIWCAYDISRGNAGVTVVRALPLCMDRSACLPEGIVIPDVVEGDVWWLMQRVWLRILGLPSRTNVITRIAPHAFAGCESMSSVTIPSTVREIGKYSFSGCRRLTAVDLPNGVEEIGQAAFSRCDGLKTVTVPGSVREIGKGVFLGCEGLTSVVVLSGVGKIGACAFAKCGRLTAVTLPRSVKEIAEDAFTCSPVQTVTVDKGDAARIRKLLGGKLGPDVQIVER